MSAAKRFLIGCGGTGGHIYPGIALARELNSRGHGILFVGNSDGMEASLVAKEGFSFRGIKVQKLYRKLSLSNVLFPFLLVSATLRVIRIIREYRPDGVICTGGFVSGPVAIAAILARMPLYFHESNSYPGLTTRFLSRYTRITFTAFSQTARHLQQTKVLQLGIPLRQEPESKPLVDPAELGLNMDKPILLVTGGSQGSQAINAAVAKALPMLIKEGWQVIWQTGKTGYAEYSRLFDNQPGTHIFDFSPQLASFYALARLALTRAGAMTISELEANCLPAILVPLPTAAENHQYHNAREQQERGLALLLEQGKLSPESLLAAIRGINGTYAGYREKLAQLPPNRATQEVTTAILEDLNKENIHAGKN